VKTVALGLSLLVAFPAWAQMYKCLDERGVTHYTDQPRPGCKGGMVDIQASPPLTGGVKPPTTAEDLARQETDFKRRQIEQQQAEANDKAALEERCERLRREHAVLASGIRVFKLNSQGEPVYFDDATRDARLAKLKAELRTCP
jgi:hypothetical protein